MRFRSLVAVIVLVLTAACGAGTGGSTEPAADPSAASGAFSITLQQQGGPVTIDKAPERIYVVDDWSLDFLIGMGVKPVGVASYFPPPPWVEAAKLEGVELTTVTDGLPLEKVAAADPDLIVDITGFTAEDPKVRDQLRQLAPVVYPPKNWLTDGWRERLLHLGAAIGRRPAAEASIAAADRTFAEIKREHPQLRGSAVTFARFDPPGSFAVIADDSDFTRRFLNTELGLTTPAAQQKAYAGGTFKSVGGVLEGVSLERLDLVDADAAAAMIWFQDRKNIDALNRQQVWRDTPVVAEKRLVDLDINAAISLRTPSPAAIRWAADTVIPKLAAAVARASS